MPLPILFLSLLFSYPYLILYLSNEHYTITMDDTREERELRLREAMAAWKRGDFPFIRSAAMFHQVPSATLTHHVNGRIPRLERQKQPTLQLLTDAQEAALADWY